MLNGKIFHKGNAYVSIPAASARDNCNSRLGKVHSSIILTIASSDVYSFRWDVMYAGGFHVNFADFHTPYPWRYVESNHLQTPSYHAKSTADHPAAHTKANSGIATQASALS